MTTIRRWASAAALPALMLVSGPATATEYCVGCSGPDATYRCQIEGASASGPADPVSQILSINKIATEGGHERCSIERFSKEGCDGPVKVIAGNSGVDAVSTGDDTVPGSAPDPSAAPTNDTPAKAEDATPAADGNAKPAVEAAAEPKAADDKPPQTVEALAKQSMTSTKENLDKAGNAVSDGAKKAGDQIEGAGSAITAAAKRSWTCVTSLFSDC